MIRSPLALLAAGAAIVTIASEGATTRLPVLRVVSERVVPLTLAADVRWVDGDHVLIADADRGIARVAISGRDASVSWLAGWPVPAGPGSRYFHLGLSGGSTVAGDFAFGVGWREQRAESPIHKMSFEYVADLDLDGGRLLISGLRRDANGDLGSDGATAWIGSLTDGDAGLRPVLPFKNRGTIENCAGFGLGAVRFLANGSFLIVPGSERGIYLFGKEGRLARVWQTDELGLDVDCDLTRDEQVVLTTKPVARQQWVNRRAIVDDIVDTPNGPALIVRKVAGGRTNWEMVVLNDGPPSVQQLPVTSTSPWAHVSAATRGKGLVLLIADRVPGLADGAAPRLMHLQWSQR
ncbi:MAG: hypothetical protein M3P29_00985 [Acidobacteriota bacterium]|nr:hypothetical protein [Acidobacteriota bacterium]